MKTLLLFPVFTMFCLVHFCKAQSYTHVYYLDEKLKPVKESRAVITGKGLNEDGLFRLDCFNSKAGNIRSILRFTDSSLKIQQGNSTEFYSNGLIEMSGNYLKNQKDGLWQHWYKNIGKNDSIIYKEGKIATITTCQYYDKGKIGSWSFTDNNNNTFKEINYDETGHVSSEVFFTGQVGALKRYDSGKVVLDTVYSREEKEASFPGGLNGWIRYLQKNLNANVPIVNGAPDGTYQVFIKFIVTKDGSLTNVAAETKFGYGMEMEGMRIISYCPKWIPAIQYGRAVNAYRRQPITFVIETKPAIQKQTY